MRTRVSSEATTSERRDDRARERMNMVETSSIWEKMRVAVQVSAKKVGAAEIRTTTKGIPTTDGTDVGTTSVLFERKSSTRQQQLQPSTLN